MTSSPHSKFLDPRAIERIKRLDVRARLVVEGFLSGQHQSPFQGFAVEFASHREYTQGDEFKHIDWKVWSRTDRLVIKQYEEETNLQCTLIVDCSKSMRYAGAEKDGFSKFDYAATAAASLAWLLHQQQDQVGLVTFHNQVAANLPSSSHPVQMKQLLHVLEQTSPDGATDLTGVFPTLAAQIRRPGLVALFSDLFLDLPTLAETLRQFRLRRHDVALMHVLHHDELHFPFQDNTLFRGLESTAQVLTDPRALRRSYLNAMERYRGEIRQICGAQGVDYILLDTGQPLDAALAGYLAFRHKHRRKIRRK